MRPDQADRVDCEAPCYPVFHVEWYEHEQAETTSCRNRGARISPMRKILPAVFGLLLLIGLSNLAFSDAGMWLYNAPPLKQLKEKYNFEPTKEWLEHLQKSSVRFNSGGSGSFVSPNGLCITNHHIGLDTLQKISTEQHNYVRDGFYAKSQAEEVKAADLELNVLMSIEDVTAEVQAAVQPGMSAENANKARTKIIAQIEKESKRKPDCARTSSRSTGGVYNLYRYKQ